MGVIMIAIMAGSLLIVHYRDTNYDNKCSPSINQPSNSASSPNQGMPEADADKIPPFPTQAPTLDSSDHAVVVNWADNGDYTTHHFTICRAESGGAGHLRPIGRVITIPNHNGSEHYSYRDSTVIASHTYAYAVLLTDNYGNETLSASTTTLSQPK